MVTAITAQPASHTAASVIAKAAHGKLAGLDPQDFVRANRIHIKDGSLFMDPYLVIHPRELAPANEAYLRQKLQLTYSINNPSFYESVSRRSIALNLAQLLPISLPAQHSKLMEQIKKYNAQVDTGVDANLTKLDRDKHQPFAAIVRDTLTHPAKDPIGIETLKNGLAMYLLVRQKLTEQGYLDEVSAYITPSTTPDKVLGELAGKIGVTPLQMREAAIKNGLDGVGVLLGLTPAYVADVKQLAQQAAHQEFSHNLVEHWHLGNQLLRAPNASLQQKCDVGMQARITNKIQEFRAKAHHVFEVPEPVKAEEKRIAESLNMLEPIQRALMYKLGYEISYTPDYYADSIAKYNNIYGLHRKAANDMRDVRGTYRIYFSGRGELKDAMRTMVHEVAHNLWPEQFSADEVTKIDALVASDAAHFARWQTVMGEPEHFMKFERFFNAYKAGNDAEKAAVVASANQWLAHHGVTVDGLFPYLREARDFQFMVKHAVDTLSVEGERYAKSGYDSPHERFREVISRFAELKQVEHRADPQLLHFLAPGLDQVWEAHYIPHLKRVYQKVMASDVPAAAIAHAPSKDTGDAAPKVAERPAEPKVEQRPVTPVHTASGEPCMSDQTPRTMVDNASITDMQLANPQIAAAVQTLGAMGVGMGRQ